MNSGELLRRRSASKTRASSPLVFFVDRSLGGKIVPNALRVAGRTVEVHDDHFESDAPDTEWIPDVTSRGWVILTRDENIGRNPLELEALLFCGARAFILTSNRVTGEEQARIVVEHLPKIEILARRKRGAILGRVTRTDVRIWKTGLPPRSRS